MYLFTPILAFLAWLLALLLGYVAVRIIIALRALSTRSAAALAGVKA